MKQIVFKVSSFVYVSSPESRTNQYSRRSPGCRCHSYVIRNLQWSIDRPPTVSHHFTPNFEKEISVVRLPCIFIWRFSYSQGIAHYPNIHQMHIHLSPKHNPSFTFGLKYSEAEKWRNEFMTYYYTYALQRKKRAREKWILGDRIPIS